MERWDRKAGTRKASSEFILLCEGCTGALLRSFVPLLSNYSGNDNEIVEQRNAAQIVCQLRFGNFVSPVVITGWLPHRAADRVWRLTPCSSFICPANPQRKLHSGCSWWRVCEDVCDDLRELVWRFYFLFYCWLLRCDTVCRNNL